MPHWVNVFVTAAVLAIAASTLAEAAFGEVLINGGVALVVAVMVVSHLGRTD